MNSEKYIGLDVHQATICAAVMDPTGKVVMESILETKAATILEFFAGVRGTLSVTLEEGTWAAWPLRQPSTEPQSRLVVDFLDVHENLTWTGACHAKDLPLASDYRPDYGPE